MIEMTCETNDCTTGVKCTTKQAKSGAVHCDQHKVVYLGGGFGVGVRYCRSTNTLSMTENGYESSIDVAHAHRLMRGERIDQDILDNLNSKSVPKGWDKVTS